MNKFMKIAIEEAKIGINSGHGGPFGCVIVCNGQVISKGHNMVIKNNDPTAHGEIVAIREAGKVFKSFDLSGCVLYTTSEPCPMCYGAIHWARISTVYYGCTQFDALNIGFDDGLLYEILKRDDEKSSIKMYQINRDECLHIFSEYEKDENRIIY